MEDKCLNLLENNYLFLLLFTHGFARVPPSNPQAARSSRARRANKIKGLGHSARALLRPQLLTIPFAMLREPSTGEILDQGQTCPVSQVFTRPA